MYPISANWKTANEAPLRNPSHVRVTFGIQDPDAPGASTLTDNGHLLYSAVEDIIRNIAPTQVYQTLERNRFILDGRSVVPDENDLIYQAYIGKEISGDDGYWQKTPKIRIDMDGYFSFAGITMEFDNSTGDYPREMLITAEYDNELVFSESVYPDGTSFITPEIPLCNRVTIEWVASTIPHRRARLLYLVFGIIEELQDGDLVSCSSEKSVDLLSTKFPKQDFTFTILDTEKRYDPENPKGVWEFLESRQPVSYSYGFEMDDGSIEWIPWGQSYSTGDFSVSGQESVSKIDIKCSGLIEYLNQEYDQGVYSENGTSLWDLATAVAAFAGFLDAIELDDDLKDIYTKMPLPAKPINTCLQLIANAGRCVMNHTRGGYISIRRENTARTEHGFDFHNMTEPPATTKIPPLRNLTTEYTDITPADAATNAVDTTEITGANGEEYVFTYDGFTDLTATVSGLTIIGTPRFYAYKAYIALSGTGTITISGKKLNSVKLEYKKQYSVVGEDLDSIKNELINSKADAEAYADWVAANTMRRVTYKSKDRGYPELDVGDNVGMVGNFNNPTEMTLTRYKTTYNGAISGEFEGIAGGGGT